MKKISEYRAAARETLDGRWGEMALITLILVLIGIAGQIPNSVGTILGSTALHYTGTCINLMVALFLTMPLWYAFAVLLLSCARGNETSETYMSELWSNFTGHWDTYVLAGLLLILIGIAVFIVLALSLLLYFLIGMTAFFITIPLIMVGIIILSLIYGLVPFIIQDNPGISARDALEMSRMMMDGHLLRFFLLNLSFIGWWILCVFTLFVGTLWLNPYVYTAQAHFYEDVKAEYETEQAQEVQEIQA